jgi:hypothetical protein
MANQDDRLQDIFRVAMGEDLDEIIVRERPAWGK